MPFLDHEVVALVAQMPIAMKINGMTDKSVRREAARPVLTDNLYRRQKHPFLSPPSTLRPPLLIGQTLAHSRTAGTTLHHTHRTTGLASRLPA